MMTNPFRNGMTGSSLEIAASLVEPAPKPQTPDPIIALGHELERAIAAIDAADQDGRDYGAEVRRVNDIAERIVAMRATSLVGAAIQARALNGLDHLNGGEDVYNLTVDCLSSIVAVLDKAAGLKREQFGGGYFLPAPHSPVVSQFEILPPVRTVIVVGRLNQVPTRGDLVARVRNMLPEPCMRWTGLDDLPFGEVYRKT